jgi:hypothetical protein
MYTINSSVAQSSVSFSLSFNGFDWITTPLIFRYDVNMPLLSIAPSHGPESGGNMVTIVANNLQPGSRCKFGNVFSNMSVVINLFSIDVVQNGYSPQVN